MEESRLLNPERYVDVPKDWEFISPSAVEIRKRLIDLGLQENIVDLETLGYTVLPPGKVGTPEQIDRLREATLDVTERRRGRRLDLLRDENPGVTGFGHFETYLLFEDPVFRQFTLDPTILALVDYMVGTNAIITTVSASFKGQAEEDLPLHADHTLIPEPFPAYNTICNATIALTDYSRKNGGICFVPGSHHYHRHPRPGEALEHRVPVEAPAGSMIFWGGSLWHGAFARKTPGLRMAFLLLYRRPHYRALEPYREDVTDELLSQYPPRFATLMGKDMIPLYRGEGPAEGDKSWRMGRHHYD